MSRRSRESKRRLNSSLWALILIAVLLIVSTYAWFSANKVVTLDGIQAKVSAAEGLQISLDGENWSSNITLNEAALEKVTKAVNNYVWPNELRPVSTDGHVTGGDFEMFSGEVSSDGSYLSGAAKNNSDYIVFDLYFKNSSSQETDPLQLNIGTMLQVSTESLRNITGLENSARMGMIVYDSSAVLTETPENIRKLAAGTSPKTSIWEPNYNKHIAEVAANDDRIANTTSVFNTLALQSITPTTIEGAGEVVANINAKTEDEDAVGNLKEQVTMQTDYMLTAAQNMTDINSAIVTLKGNAITKARVYIWLEGQDPDCIDTASTGQSLDFVLSFTKPDVRADAPDTNTTT